MATNHVTPENTQAAPHTLEQFQNKTWTPKMDKEAVLDQITNFGPYQWLLLCTIWWANITTVGNIVFMVFGGAGDKSIIIADETCTKNCSNTTVWTFYSFVAQWSLDSDSSKWIASMMASVQLAGALIGALIGGQLADWYGRKLNTWVWLGVTVVLGPLSAFSQDFKTMTAFRFFIGLSTGGYDSSAIILVMEWVNSKSRLPVQTSLDCVNSLGFIWFSLLAYLCHDWRLLSVVCCLQGFPCLLAFFWLEEPAQWLLLKGEAKKCEEVVRKVSRWNKAAVPVAKIYDPVDVTKKLSVTEECSAKNKRKSTYCDLFHTKTLIQYSLMLTYSFLITGTTGYLLIFNAGNLLGNIYLNFALLGAVNTVSAMITVFGNHFLKLGRRKLHQICLNGVWLSFAVIILIYCLNIQEKVATFLVSAAMVGSMFSFPLWVVCNLYSGELYPTKIRNMGSGIGSMAARTGGIIAPLVLYLFDLWKPLPFLTTGCGVILNAVLAFFFLPETRGQLQEQMMKNKKEEDSCTVSMKF